MHGGQKVNVVMPVYNEERTLGQITRRVLKQREVDKLIMVNDCSKDKSLEIMKKIAKKDRRVSCTSNPHNMGKGFSVRRGLEFVKNGVVIVQDADLEYYPEDYPRLLAALEPGKVVYGTRMVQKNPGHHYYLAKFANYFITLVFNVLYSQRITDLSTCYKVFTKEQLHGIALTQNRFLFDPELSVKFAKKGYGIKETTIRYKGRTYEEGKKITWKDAIRYVLYIIAKRFMV